MNDKTNKYAMINVQWTGKFHSYTLLEFDLFFLCKGFIYISFRIYVGFSYCRKVNYKEIFEIGGK